MTASINQILHPYITTKVISQIAVAENPMLGLFGFQPGGPCELRIGHRRHGYDIFNNTRTVGQVAAPGEPAKTVTRQVIGRVNNEIPRMHEKLPLGAEELYNNFRPLGGNAGTYDGMNGSYVVAQQRFLGQRAGNFRSALLGGMMRGKCYVHPSGNDLYVDYTSGANLFTIDYQMPAGNTNQLNMLGAGNIINGSWASSSTDIPSHLEQIDVALQNLVGKGLQRIVCGAQMWTYVTNNDYVAMKAGIAARPFELYTREPAGTFEAPANLKFGRLAAIPWLEWVITDAVLSLGAQGSTTATKLVPDNTIWFGPRTPDSQFFQIALGSEPISEGPNMNPVIKMGLSAWTTYTHDPTGMYLFALDNALPCNYIPAGSGFATVVF